jgi:hypothetical protein
MLQARVGAAPAVKRAAVALEFDSVKGLHQQMQEEREKQQQVRGSGSGQDLGWVIIGQLCQKQP